MKWCCLKLAVRYEFTCRQKSHTCHPWQSFYNGLGLSMNYRFWIFLFDCYFPILVSNASYNCLHAYFSKTKFFSDRTVSIWLLEILATSLLRKRYAKKAAHVLHICLHNTVASMLITRICDCGWVSTYPQVWRENNLSYLIELYDSLKWLLS